MRESKKPQSCVPRPLLRVTALILSMIYFSQPSLAEVASHPQIECKLYRTIDRDLPIASLMAQEKVFVPIDCKSATFGFSSDVFWIKVTVTPEKGTKDLLDLEIGYPPLDNIQFFNNEGTLIRKTGDSLPFASRDYKNRNYIFPLDAKADNAPIVSWFRITSQGSIQAPIVVYTQQKMTEKTAEEYLGFGLYYGIILAMIVYNAFLFLIVRERAYFYYVFYISCYGLFQLSLNGLGYMYIWPNLTNWNNYSIPILIAGMFFFVFLFSKRFLETASFAPRVDKMLTGLTIAAVSLGLASLVVPLRWSIMGVVLFSFLAASAVWMAGWRTFRAGYEPSRYFLIAWSSFLAGIILISLKNFGLVPSFFITDYGMQIGSAVEVMMLSFGLGYRIKQMELMKAAAERESSVMERNAAEYKLIARMTQMLAHDVRKPFSSLKTAIRLLLSASDGNQARSLALKYLPELDRQLQSVDGMIQDVMQVGAEHKLSCETVNISELIRAALNDSVSSLDDRDVLITYDLQNRRALKVDRLKVQRIMSNIVSNAFQAMEARGILQIAARDVVVNGLSYVECSVYNNGKPIPHQDLPNLFEPFFTKNKREGTGLGLAIARKIAQEHGGQIWCESEDDGVKFLFTLPASLDFVSNKDGLEALPATAQDILQRKLEREPANDNVGSQMGLEEAIVEHCSQRGRGLSIALVDDDEVYHTLVESYVKGSNELQNWVEIKYFTDPQMAIDYNISHLDLSILDVDYGTRLNGFDIAKSIREHSGRSKICIHSNLGILDLQREVARANIDLYLPKPMSRGQFLAILHAASGINS